MKTKFVSILVIIAFLIAPVTQVHAATQIAVSDNPNSIVGKIVPFESIQFNPGMAYMATSGCKTYTLGVAGYSIVGIQVWSYAWNIYWCYNGSTITSLSKWRTVWANYGWSFKGDIADNQSGGVGSSSYWHYAQGDFCFIETYTCISHSYPWVNQTVYGSGGQSGSAGS